MKKFIFSISFIMLIFCSQNALLQAEVETRSSDLLTLSQRLSKEYAVKHTEALEIAERLNFSAISTLDDGTMISLQYFTESGHPVFYSTNNIIAAESISTDEVWTGGNANLNLDGSGMTLHEWDAGKVRTTHQEFTGRVTIGDTGNTTLHSHSTHVAGTMIAAGVDPTAIGMSYAAELIDFDWNNDDAEMASEAAGGALISNHSYGSVAGWYWNYFSDSLWAWVGDISVSTVEDYWFGFYSSLTQSWDQIAYDAPYYLICKSAGNDRNDNGPAPGTEHWIWDGEDFAISTDSHDPDGQYDCIPTKGNGKNILTVGAVNDIFGGYTNTGSVVATSFTSWGPADDGRIKPDICGNGLTLWSPIETGDDQYTLKSGTSMSSPSVAGSAGLLQQHYNDLYRSYMLSATLKGLIIHTADEAGPDPGPDYMFGWGLMNTQTAAEVISNIDVTELMQEETLSNGETFEIDLITSGNEPLKVTICWTDIPGTPPADVVDPSDIMLVNDLDLRVSNERQTGYPWKLDPANPDFAATNNGDNNVDNVEKIEIASPGADTWRITVNHKGSLSSPQDFSIFVSGVILNPPVISTDPISIEVSLLPDATETEDFRIFNDGTGPLIYDCLLNYLTRSDIIEEDPSNFIIPQPEEIELVTETILASEIPGEERDDHEIFIDNEDAYNFMGVGQNYWWSCATRLTADELSAYYGSYTINKLKILVSNYNEVENYTNLTFKIWEGGSLGDAGNLVYSYDVTEEAVPGQWMIHELEYAIFLQPGNEYWIGYSVVTPEAGGNPSVRDSGPVVPDKGEWYDWGNNGVWAQLGWNTNWKIRCFITSSWLTITSNASGEVSAPTRDFTDVEILFDSSTFTAGESKTANIHIVSNDPYSPLIEIPVTMNIVANIPEAPEIQSITISGDDVQISWNSVAGALSYSIYSDTDPYGNFYTEEASGLTSTNWTDYSAAEDKKFYIIKSNY